MAGVLKPQTFNCMNCGAGLEVNAVGSANTIVCTKCNSMIDVSHPIYKVFKKQNDLLVYAPKIPLGSFGMIRGIKWKIIGYMIREDKEYHVEWNEYLLYNPYHGYRFLFEIDDHYTLLQRYNSSPAGMTVGELSSFELPPYGEFKIYNRGKATVKFVVGEFYWRVRVGEKTEIDDYICPPYIFSAEKSKGEINYTIGEYIPISEIKQAFASVPSLNLPEPWKTGQNQPNPYSKNLPSNLKVWAYSILAVTTIAVMTLVTKPKNRIFSASLTASDFNSAENTYVSAPFEIKGRSGNVEVFILSPVVNQWLSVDIDLVNEKTGEAYSTDTGVEYYSGSDYDGSWSEGSNNNDTLISMVPAGTYHLEMQAASDMPSKEVSVTLSRHGNMGWNFALCLLMISIYPLWALWRRRSFEVSRWENSSYSPYYVHSYESDDEDWS